MPDAFVFKRYQFTLDVSNIRETGNVLKNGWWFFQLL